MSKPLIVYDLDGTLIDTAADLLDSLNHVVTADGLSPIDKDSLRPHVGFGGRVMLTNAYAQANKHLEPEKLDHLVDQFVAHYANHMPGISRPFDGLLDSMRALQDAGFRFAICTNKTEYLAKKLIEQLDLSHWFEVITGQDTFPVRKPHPDHLIGTIELIGADKRKSVMVGDTPTDFSTAKAAMIPVIAVDFGYCATSVHQYHPEKIISHYSEMTPDVVLNMIKAQ